MVIHRRAAEWTRAECADRAKRLRHTRSRESHRHQGPHGDAVDPGRGKQYFYHLVTDASAAVPAVLEKGVVDPKLAKIPQFGESLPGEKSALLGFSPVLNGRTDKGSGEDQGFSTALANGVDPINVFPIGPDNDNRSRKNNYSPLWDAHVSMWTQSAIDTGKVHRIHSMDEQKSLIREDLLTSASINPPGPANPYVGGPRPTQAIIDCPVIAHPDLPPQVATRSGTATRSADN